MQDINGYRNAPGSPPLPRILLVVDEFQEFFVEEDKLAQDAALWLDRLVRQGRAFGIHVLLGSQSLSGAFTLARSTLGQMAVRIALQCSETDAHLILSENNVAAQDALAARRGDLQRRQRRARGQPLLPGRLALRRAPRGVPRSSSSELARERKPVLARTPIVFEGDAAGRPGPEPAAPRAARRAGLARRRRDRRTAWLGDAVAIKDPTAALFRRLGGNHLSIVGQNDEAALGVMAAALLEPGRPVSAGRSDDRPLGGPLLRPRRHARGPSRRPACSRAWPRPCRTGSTVGGWRDAARILAEVARRSSAGRSEGGDGPEIFLFIHDLPRFRDLRRREDEFSFSRREDERQPRRPPRRDPPRRARPGRPRHHLVRHGEQPEPPLRPPDAARVRDARSCSR